MAFARLTVRLPWSGVISATMRKDLLKFAGLTAIVVLGGCRFQGKEAFLSSTTPVEYAANRRDDGWKGDPYAFGGSADASGGLKSQTSYGAGSNPRSTEPIDPTYDRPAKGTGQHPTDQPVQAAPGHGLVNAPSFQPQAGSSESPTVRSAR